VEATAQEYEHTHLELNARALRARMLLTQHRSRDALEATSLSVDVAPTPAIYGEYLATHALTLAVTAARPQAVELAREARTITSVSEVRALAAVAEAVAAIDEPSAHATAMRALRVAIDLETWDPLVCGMRAAPKLAQTLATH